MKAIIGIYKITNPKGNIYIGQSWNIYNRWKSYKEFCKNRIGAKLYYSLKKYGIENHIFEIIHEFPYDVEQSILDNYEIFCIDQYKCNYNKFKENNGLNLTNGGGGSKGLKHTEDTKIKMRKAKEGKYYGKENPNYGKGLFGEKNGMYGKKRPRELIEVLRNKSSKIVLQYSTDGNFINRYRSSVEAMNNTGINKNSIYCCCSGNQIMAGGFIWRYEGKEFVPPRDSDNLTKVLQFSTDRSFIKEWASIAEANRSLNVKSNNSGISRCARGKQRTCKGYIWKYKENTVC